MNVDLSVQELEAFKRNNNSAYLTQDMVNWAVTQIRANHPQQDRILNILEHSYTECSYVWKMTNTKVYNLLKEKGRSIA